MAPKHRKSSSKPAAASGSAPDRPVNVAAAAIATGLGALQARIEALSTELATPKGLDDKALRDKSSHLAWLMKQIAQVQAEQRKAVAAERKAATDVDPQAANAYLRSLSAAEWSHVRREIDAHHSGRSVLA